MEKVTLTTAFEWVCGECGRQNFCSSVKLEDPEMIQKAREEHGYEGELCTMPNQVTCQHCREVYETEED